MVLAPFDLNLRHLRAVTAIMARGSMSAAVEAEGLSQPALTQGLAKLERQFGIALFERRSDGVRPTEAGQRMVGRANAAFAHPRRPPDPRGAFGDGVSAGRTG
jgi:DNA-binding transcriptional LysR family regulator